MPFNQETVRSYEEWLQSPVGYYVDRREKQLIADLLAPRNGETLLDVGCRAGHHLLFFRRKGCDVTGIDSPPHMLEMARKKLGERADFHEGCSEDLPFSDNEFDIVTITSLGCASDPRKAIGEALRVCKGRIFLGVCNRYSLASAQRQKHQPFYSNIESPSSLLSIYELFSMVREVHSGEAIRWGSVISFPLGWYPFATGLEEKIPTMKNPFGSFIGMALPAIYTHITIQQPLKDTLRVAVGKDQRAPLTKERQK